MARSWWEGRLPNEDEMDKLFGGKTATGERAFSTVMARSDAFLPKQAKDLVKGLAGSIPASIIDGEEFGYASNFAGNGVSEIGDDFDSTRESMRTYIKVDDASPSIKNDFPPIKNDFPKRKGEGNYEDSEVKKRMATLDKALEALTAEPSKFEKIKSILAEIEISKIGSSEKQSGEFFVQAMRCLSEGAKRDVLMNLENDEQRWFYLDGEAGPSFRLSMPVFPSDDEE